MGQVTVFSGPQRRRRWSDEQKLQILSEAFTPGACSSEVARRHDISRGQLYTWRIAEQPLSRLDELLPWKWNRGSDALAA